MLSCRLAAALLLTLSLPASNAAEFQVDMIQFTPWAQRNPDKNAAAPYTGIVVDFLDEFERRSGHKTHRTLTPYIRVEMDLESGAIDFSIMAWGDARARIANKGTCLVPLDFGVRARKGISLQSYEDLYKITTSASRGLKIDPRFDKDEAARKDMVLDYTMGVKKTAARRDSDAVGGSLSTINYLINSLGLDEAFGDTLVLNTTHLTVAYSKRAAQSALEAEVQAVFKTMVDDGTAKRIYGKWLGQHLNGLKGEGRAPSCKP
ncbi:transporter substrate-binding domain-containing protein [Paucibacter soli]|uniref:transporter substrate-binding domain-containing protein n=1 Tax=Paucibacter soli TaxID=3133433 RepID=UPI0030A160DE